MGDNKPLKVEDLLTETEVRHIVDRCKGPRWKLVGSSLAPAGGMGGFMADHFRLTLDVQEDVQVEIIKLFVKSVPRLNPVKKEFIQENGFFDREMAMFKLLDEMDTGPIQWAPKGLLYNESIMVMSDLVPAGYTICSELDLPHMLVALASVARFHASVANYDTKKGIALDRPYSLMEDFGKVIVESSFRDTPWIRTAAKLIADIVQCLSKYKDMITDLSENILKQFLAGFADLTETDSLNVIIHKDLWVNNIMFKYEDGVPTNAIIVDYQCIRYGPPAFDIAVLLYFTTSRSFREQHEDKILRHYFKAFTDCLDTDTKSRLKGLGYDYEAFLRWMGISRRFGMVTALILLPYVMMDPVNAKKVYNDPVTFEQVAFVDRTEPVLEYAAACPKYGQKLLEITEEFVERYLQR